MAFLDKIKEAGVKGMDKAAELGELGKTKLEIASAEVKMKDLYAKIGTALCKEHPEVAEEFFQEDVTALKELEAKIAELEEKIANNKEK